MKYVFIAQHKKTWPIDLMCRLLGVKRNGYYRYQQRDPNSAAAQERREMIGWIKEIAESSKSTYGTRRMKAALNVLGYPVSRSLTRKLMREADVQVRYRKKFKSTTDSNHKKPLFDNVLDRRFEFNQPDQAYVSDITYIWTQEGWLYLAVVIDLFSRKIVGWSIASRMTATLVCDALMMAIWQRRPAPGLIVHSDRGSQYASHKYRELLKSNDCVGSMSRKGNCWDNAVAESFFGSLKQERVQWKQYQTRAEAHQDILNYITVFYNSYRMHSYLGYKSPNQYEKEMIETKIAA